MKQSLLPLVAVALSSIPLIASADASMYGSIRLVGELRQHDDASLEKDASIGNSGSRFGLRGSEELGNGLKIGGRYEFGVTADKGSIAAANDTDNDGQLDEIKSTNRLAYVSLEGGFGEIHVGTVWSSYWNAAGDAHPGNDFTGDGNVTTFRLEDSIKWTKAFGGAKVSLLAQLEDGLQRAQGSLGFNRAGFGVVVGLDMKEESADNADDGHQHTTLNLSYQFENGLSLHAILQNKDADDIDEAVSGYNLNGVYAANDNTFILSFGDNDTDLDDDETLTFELARKLGKNSRAWVSTQTGDQFTSLNLGLRHDW